MWLPLAEAISISHWCRHLHFLYFIFKGHLYELWNSRHFIHIHASEKEMGLFRKTQHKYTKQTCDSSWATDFNQLFCFSSLVFFKLTLEASSSKWHLLLTEDWNIVLSFSVLMHGPCLFLSENGPLVLDHRCISFLLQGLFVSDQTEPLNIHRKRTNNSMGWYFMKCKS